MVTLGDKSIIVDPGSYTDNLKPVGEVMAIVITHEHSDHMSGDLISNILDQHPDAILFAHESITTQLPGSINAQAVKTGDVVESGPFRLEFFGGEHAVIYADREPVHNLGVMINDAIYYPGDSLVSPRREVHALALPITAPWVKISEIIDFINRVNTHLIFPTHDATASDIGKALLDTMLEPVVTKSGARYLRLSGTIEIK